MKTKSKVYRFQPSSLYLSSSVEWTWGRTTDMDGQYIGKHKAGTLELKLELDRPTATATHSWPYKTYLRANACNAAAWLGLLGAIDLMMPIARDIKC